MNRFLNRTAAARSRACAREKQQVDAANASDLSTEQFNWFKDTRTLSQEISTLGRHLKLPVRALRVKSHHTGKVAIFRYVRTDYDGPSHEREVAGWWFRSDVFNIDLLIIND